MTPALMRDMSTLYLVHQKDGQVMIFTGLGDHTWQMTRLPSQQLAKVRMIMSFGRHGWQIKEGGVKIQASMPLAEQDPECPPLGAWHGIASGIAWAGDWVLQVEAPQLPPLELPPSICKKSFSLDAVALEDHVVRVDLTIHREPLTDEDVELCFGAMQRGVQEFAKRPEKTLLLSFSLQDASIPAMRHVKRLVALSHDMGHLLLLVARGSAIILRPHGFLGTAMVAIVRFVQNHAAAPWPETIVPSMVEAEAFLLAQRPARLSPSARDIINAAETLGTPSNVASDTPGEVEQVKVWRGRSKSIARKDSCTDSCNPDLWVPAEREVIADVAELEFLPPRTRPMRRWWLCLECS